MKNRYGVLIKSDRALEAEENGLVTFTNLSAWQKRAVKARAVYPREWHHTGAAANETYYYSPEDFEELNPADFPAEKIMKENQADLSRLKIKIVYDVMVSGFTRGARAQFTEYNVCGLDVRKKDNKITGARGRRLSSKNKKVTYLYLPPKCRKWREITRAELEEIRYKFA